MFLMVIAFIVMPLLELYVIIQVGQEIGALNTILVMVVMSVIGAWLAKHEGAYVLRRLQEQLDAGRMPTNELIDGGLILAGGVMLLFPGFISDALGLLLLFPPTRAIFRGILKRRFRIITISRGGPSGPPPPDDVIDV
jgi:UPF0716 protein FxsA